MFYVQATIAKINEDILAYYDTLTEAKRNAKRIAKDNDYSHVYYGGFDMLRVTLK